MSKVTSETDSLKARPCMAGRKTPFLQSHSLILCGLVLLLSSACSPRFTTHSGDTAEAEDEIKKSSATCAHRLKGRWGFGLTPYGCAMPAEATLNAKSNYADYVLSPMAANKSLEQKRYVKLMNDFIIQTAEDYLHRREPNATEEEKEAWVTLILTVAHQESYWTHYRVGEDQIFRLLRGDNYHGYGLMQIDDRWHKRFIASQEVYDLKSHLIYALDLLFSARAQVLKKPCVSEKNWDNYNRSIYSIYNGGIGSKCRWENRSHRWYKNDKGFLAKYLNQIWEKILGIFKTKETKETKETKKEDDKKVIEVKGPVEQEGTQTELEEEESESEVDQGPPEKDIETEEVSDEE